MFNSNIWPNSAPLRDICFQNVSDLNLWGVIKVKCNRINGLPIYAFLLMFNSNIGHNSVPLQDIMLQNLSDLNFGLSRSLKVIGDGVVGLFIYGFVLKYTRSHISTSHRLPLIGTRFGNAFPNFSPFRSTIARFPDNWACWFLHRVNSEFKIFEKKIFKIGN